MKIKIEITEWSGWRGGSSNTTEKILPITFFKRTYKFKGHGKVFFGFKVIGKGKDYFKIKTFADAGNKFNIKTRKYEKIPPFILKIGENQEFSTHTMDWGMKFKLEVIKKACTYTLFTYIFFTKIL